MKNGILFTADMHLRDDTPVCRTDDFQKAQWDKLQAIITLVKRKNLYWVDCGDIFHKARPGYKLLNRFMDTLIRQNVCIDTAICGNHDMPAHSLGQIDDSAFGTLLSAKLIKTWLYGRPVVLPIGEINYVLWGVNYTEKPYEPDPAEDGFCNVMVMHDMMFLNKKDAIPNVEGYYANTFVKEWDHYQYIFTGHNHKTFTYQNDNTYLCNVGCLTRQTADMADHRPTVAVLYADHVAQFTLPYSDDVVTREHIDKKQKREDEIAAFVETLGKTEEVSLSFTGNVQLIVNKVKPSDTVKQKIQGAME